MSEFHIVKDRAFERETIKLMAAAFDRAMKSLILMPPQSVQQAMARRIVQAAHTGERNLDELTKLALHGDQTGLVLTQKKPGARIIDSMKGIPFFFGTDCSAHDPPMCRNLTKFLRLNRFVDRFRTHWQLRL